jgi:SAM-dependent methyltransferase
MKNDNFINIAFRPSNMDLFIVRRNILASIDKVIPQLKGKLLDAGCGKMPYREYILQRSDVDEYVGLDIETALTYDPSVKPDVYWNGKSMPFADASFDCCMATEVLEHCPEPEIFLREVNRVLKPGGLFFFTVPFLWNLHEVPHDEYRYTPFSLRRHLSNANFSQIKIEPSGGWHSSMAQMIGLWVNRAPLGRLSRKILSFILFPFYFILMKVDDETGNLEGLMIPGVRGRAVKS